MRSPPSPRCSRRRRAESRPAARRPSRAHATIGGMPDATPLDPVDPMDRVEPTHATPSHPHPHPDPVGHAIGQVGGATATGLSALGDRPADAVLGMPNAPEPGLTTGIRMLDVMLDKAVAVPSGTVRAHVDRLRTRNPEASPAQIVAILEKQYLLAVAASGGAVGAVAAAPAVGTGTATALTATDVAAFFAASAAFALAVAEVHGIAVEDVARRRTLLLATVLGEQGAKTVGEQTGLGSAAWAKGLLVNMPTTTIRRVNAALTRRLVRRQAAKHGAIAFGRLLPFGVGAVIGVSGGRALGKTVVDGARKAFGNPPDRFPRTIEIAPPEVVVAARELDLLPTLNRRAWLRGRRGTR